MMARIDMVLARVHNCVSHMDARCLLSYVLGRSTAWCVAHQEALLDQDQLASFEALVQRRQQGEPIAYLIGRRGFWTFELEVSPATLIPRPETETLVESVLAQAPLHVPLRLADLGTGSGAIALALASERPQATVVATDRSQTALAIANANRQRYGLTNICFRQGDWCEPLRGETFDVIASNPPYVAASDPHLLQGDIRFEPQLALVGGSDGLDPIRFLAIQAVQHLRPGGWLMLEHGWDQGAAVRSVLRAAGWEAVQTRCDLEQRERVTIGARPRERTYDGD